MTLAVVTLFSLAYFFFISALAVSLGKLFSSFNRSYYPLVTPPSR